MDVETDITKVLTLSTALRFEHYSDFGSALTYKLASRYQIAKPIAIRAAFNTGFRAPSLQQILYRQLTITPTTTGGTLSGVFNNSSEVARAAGVPSLQEENSRNISGAIVLKPLVNSALLPMHIRLT